MRRTFIAAAMVLGIAAILLVKGRTGTFVLPDALKSTVPETPADQNNLPRFFTAFPKFTPEIVKPLSKAEEQLDACLHWLKLERDGKPVDETGFTSFFDPVDGKSLAVDFKLRTIRSRGLNQKADPPDPEGGPLPAAGFFFSGDDFMIVVPRWRSEGSGRGAKAGDD